MTEKVLKNGSMEMILSVKFRQTGLEWVSPIVLYHLLLVCSELEEIEKEKARADAESKKKESEGKEEILDVVQKEFEKEKLIE